MFTAFKAHRRPLKTLSALLLAFSVSLVESQSCCHSGPTPLLLMGDEALLEAPEQYLQDEIEKVVRRHNIPAVVPSLVASKGGDDDERAIADLKRALPAYTSSPQCQTKVTQAYRKARETATYKFKSYYQQSLAGWGRACQLSKRKPKVPVLVLAAETPPEFSLYLRGLAIYKAGHIAEARAMWRTVLSHPVATKRRYRSVWAAFMLGKSWMYIDNDKATEWFRKARELASQNDKHVDSIGLKAASIGWEAHIALKKRKLSQALRLYLRCFSSKPFSTTNSIRMVCQQILLSKGQSLAEVASKKYLQELMTAHILCSIAQATKSDKGLIQSWLKAVKKHAQRPVRNADALAWLAYKNGRFKSAREWLALCELKSPRSQWLKVKLQLRAGDVKGAQKTLSMLISSLPADHRKARKYLNDMALIEFHRSQWATALSLFMRSGKWHDAAYVAEKIMSLDELKSWVDNAQRGELLLYEHAFQLTQLLGRRLVRKGRLKEAMKYFMDDTQEHLQRYQKLLKAGRDAKNKDAARAQALMKAARVARHQGLAMMATELDPDWAIDSGQYEYASPLSMRQELKKQRWLAVQNAEIERVKKHRPNIEKRFHYRYVAAELAWQASQLLPDNSQELARWLCESGTWLKTRDPQFADRFYKALVNRCRRTKLGQLADKKRWFPKTW